MRTISGRRNRVRLILGGIVLILAAAWVLASSLDLPKQWQESGQYLLDSDTGLGDYFSDNESWLLPTAIGVSVVLALLGIIWLIAQIPTAPSRSELRFADEDDQLLGSLDPNVFDRALEERLAEITGVTGANVRTGGSVEAPWIQANLDVDANAEVAWVVGTARNRLYEDITTVTGAYPRSVDVTVKLTSKGASQSPKTVEISADDSDKAISS